MSKIVFHKVLDELPSDLVPNSVYFVKKGLGYDTFVTSDLDDGTFEVTAVSQNTPLLLRSLGQSENFAMSQVGVTNVVGDIQSMLEGVNNGSWDGRWNDRWNGELDGRLDKVDKEDGKSLILDTEIDRLALMEDEATKNSSDEFLLDRANHTGVLTSEDILDLGNLLDTKIDKVDGQSLISDIELDRLSTISTDEFVLDRANHIGLQPIDSIEGLEDALVAAGSTGSTGSTGGGGGGGGDGDYVEKEEGKSLILDTEIDRLVLMEDEATKNSSDEFLLDRANHIGDIRTEDVDGLPIAIAQVAAIDLRVDNKIDKSSITHTEGQSEDLVISQKGLGNVVGNIESVLAGITGGGYVGDGWVPSDVIPDPTPPVSPPAESQTVRNLFDYTKGQHEVAKYHSIPVLDLYRNNGIGYVNRLTYMQSDRLHFRTIAYEKMAQQTTAFIRDYGGHVDLSGKTIGVFGASWTVRNESKACKDVWESELGVTYTDYGVAGAGFARSTNLISDQLNIAAVHDIYLLWCPSNDANLNLPVGDASDSDTTTQCGGMNVAIDKIYALNPEARILIMTSMKSFVHPYMYDPSVVRI